MLPKIKPERILKNYVELVHGLGGTIVIILNYSTLLVNTQFSYSHLKQKEPIVIMPTMVSLVCK